MNSSRVGKDEHEVDIMLVGSSKYGGGNKGKHDYAAAEEEGKESGTNSYDHY